MLKVHAGPRRLQPTYADDERRPYRRIVPEPLSPTVGAEIGGVTLSGAIDAETFEEIHRALLEYKVIFFRDQDITPEQHVGFARRFGALETHPFVPHRDGYPEVMVLKKNDQIGGYENLFVPLHVYLGRALDRMYDHLKQGRPLPPSQVVRAVPRGGTPGLAPAITAANVPPIEDAPAPGDRITFSRAMLHVPD